MHSQVFLRFPFCKALKYLKMWSGFTLGHPKTGAQARLFCRENGQGDINFIFEVRQTPQNKNFFHDYETQP